MITSSFFKPTAFKLITGSCFVFMLATTGCQSPHTTESVTKPNTPNGHSSQQNNNSAVLENPAIAQQSLMQQAWHIQQALANKNYTSIIDDIHPTRGIRFSMYAYVRPESDKVFSREQFAQYLQASKIRFTWGDLDGTGDLFVTPLPNYLLTWVDSSKFNNASTSVNEFKHGGNMINNVKDIYRKSDIVEFYYNGSDKYDGMDWRVMRLVFDDYQGKRYLVAIINDQWTV